jgi:hypothetical protein
MYPSQELSWLAAEKTALQRTIAVRRIQCVEAAKQVGRPLDWLDRIVAFGRKVSPVASLTTMPLTLLVLRAVFPQRKILRTLLSWAPLMFKAWQGVQTRRSKNSAAAS